MLTLAPAQATTVRPIAIKSNLDFVTLLASRAEREAGFAPKKMGWLPWFGRILREDSVVFGRARKDAQEWPPLEREVFEYYFVDQLTLADIARISGCTSQALNAGLLFIQRRLREALVREVLSESKVIAVDNWTLKLKGPCSTNSGLSIPTLRISL
jgi:hypothetical protein